MPWQNVSGHPKTEMCAYRRVKPGDDTESGGALRFLAPGLAPVIYAKPKPRFHSDTQDEGSRRFGKPRDLPSTAFSNSAQLMPPAWGGGSGSGASQSRPFGIALASFQRRTLMRSHGLIGRSYAGKVKQIISGSVGFDDWEWGVTLFSDDALQFKKLIYEMRFDEVSARYGEFGSFYVGSVLNEETFEDMLKL